MSYSCPLSFESIDSNISRISSLLVSSLVITYLLSINIFIIYFLLFDFMVKLFCKKDYSLIFQLSRGVKNLFRLEDKFADSGAKRLAGYFAILFLLMLVAGYNLNLNLFSVGVALIFLSCSLMDAFFNFCVGCQVYFIIKKIYPNFMS